MKPDDQFRCDVIAELAGNPAVTGERRVGVAAEDGVETLTGRVPSPLVERPVRGRAL